VAPDVLVDTDRGDRVEAVFIADQEPVPFGQDRSVGGVPRHAQAFGDPSDSQVLKDQAFQRPAQATAGDLRPRLRSRRGVLAPHMRAPGALVPADRDQ
jgi:hypothetical protein